MKACRLCQAHSLKSVVDLVNAPPSNSFLKSENLKQSEAYFPLHVFVCQNCWLVQLDAFQNANEIFSPHYVYFSSFSKSWLKHCEDYSKKIIPALGLNSNHRVIELASNDGYLLQYFAKAGIPVLGIEPTKSTAQVAVEKGIPTKIEFFGSSLAQKLVLESVRADLLIANNVLAHVPDLNDFIEGIKTLLAPQGVFTAEMPHLLELIEHNQFDTIYHEHFCYFSLHTLIEAFQRHELNLYDVERLPTHGGSLRIYVDHGHHTRPPALEQLLLEEKNKGVTRIEFYQNFQQKTDQVKLQFLSFLTEARKQGKKVAAYGAAAKGNTLLNYCGVKPDLIEFVCDASPHKQGLFLPGSHIPVVHESALLKTKPDYVVILPWNLKAEISEQLHYLREFGTQFVTAIPELRVI